MSHRLNLLGTRFGRLTVHKWAGVNKHNRSRWACRCDCGLGVVTSGANLTAVKVRSCGCLKRALAGTQNITHGQSASLYPEGFGLDLIDRAESLGKSIFTFVERAKRENKTTLAAVVGEKPAEVPEEVGVFVVEQGVVK